MTALLHLMLYVGLRASDQHTLAAAPSNKLIRIFPHRLRHGDDVFHFRFVRDAGGAIQYQAAALADCLNQFPAIGIDVVRRAGDQ